MRDGVTAIARLSPVADVRETFTRIPACVVIATYYPKGNVYKKKPSLSCLVLTSYLHADTTVTTARRHLCILSITMPRPFSPTFLLQAWLCSFGITILCFTLLTSAVPRPHAVANWARQFEGTRHSYTFMKKGLVVPRIPHDLLQRFPTSPTRPSTDDSSMDDAPYQATPTPFSAKFLDGLDMDNLDFLDGDIMHAAPAPSPTPGYRRVRIPLSILSQVGKLTSTSSGTENFPRAYSTEKDRIRRPCGRVSSMCQIDFLHSRTLLFGYICLDLQQTFHHYSSTHKKM